MKAYISLIATAALGLAACSGPESAPPPTPPESAVNSPASAAATDSSSAPAVCEAVIESNDQMRYNTDTLTIGRQCAEFTVVLKHVGQMPKAAMGHNIVITRTADMAAVAKDGQSAGAAHGFVKSGDTRIIAHTDLIGGGEEARIVLKPAQFHEGDYSFFCSFPGHEGLMRGKVVLAD